MNDGHNQATCLDDPASPCRYDEGSHGPREIHNHNQAHDCETCGPCAEDHRLRVGCYDDECCQPRDDAGVSR